MLCDVDTAPRFGAGSRIEGVVEASEAGRRASLRPITRSRVVLFVQSRSRVVYLFTRVLARLEAFKSGEFMRFFFILVVNDKTDKVRRVIVVRIDGPSQRRGARESSRRTAACR